MLKQLINLLIFILLFSCTSESGFQEKSAKKNYPKVVGDIVFNPELDSSFIQCDSFSNQYYGVAGGMIYQGELSAIKEDIFTTYTSIGKMDQTGFFTVRFKVNCKGQTGLFRTFSTNLELKEFEFDKEIAKQLLEATKELQQWEIATYKGHNYDYYQYLTFKIVDSELKEITP